MKERLISYDPSNGEALGSVPVSGPRQITDTVARARKAFGPWKEMGIDARCTLLHKALSRSREEHSVKTLSVLLCREMGKDIQRGSGEVDGAIFGGQANVNSVKNALQTRSAGGGTRIEYRPLGVVAVISPWNYPLAMAINLLIPALVAGNSVVLKPSEETPLIAQEFVEKLNEVLPKNVLQIVFGDGKQGRMLVQSEVNMIAFTGSRATGKNIMARAADGVKRLVMELGGNDPMIVMKDADLDSAAYFAVASSFENAGQMCTATERIYVDESIADRFARRVTEIASDYRVGPWNMPGVNIGPIINARQHSLIVSHLKDAEAKGATVLLGGSKQEAPYITPTVIDGMLTSMAMEREETFGPVVAMSRFSHIENAIARANDSPYGLGAVVFGGKDAPAVADRLEAGMIGINQGVGAGNAPWVGAKQSGFGYHGSADGHRQFAQLRVVSQ